MGYDMRGFRRRCGDDSHMPCPSETRGQKKEEIRKRRSDNGSACYDGRSVSNIGVRGWTDRLGRAGTERYETR